MKKVFLFIVIIVAAFYLFSLRPTTVKNTASNTNVTGSNLHPDPSGTTFTLDDGETSSPADTEILAKTAYGDLNADGKQDAAVLLAHSGGGSGVFIYVAAYLSGPINYKGSNAVFLGDRVAPQDISIKNGVMTVSYLDRGPDEPFAAEPTIPHTKHFVYRNGELIEQ